MLRLLKPFFGGRESPGHYPESLIRRAIDRVCEGTDPRLRLLPGYKKKLRGPVIHAIDHIVSLVDSFPEPLEASARSYGNSPLLRALFSSPARMLEVLAADINLNRYLREHTLHSGKIRALLLAEQTSRNVLGSELVGDRVRRDVKQHVISFDEHRLVGLEVNREKARSELGSQAFNHLLALALEEISDTQEERQSLNRQRTLLQRKLRTLDRGGWSFEKSRADTGIEPISLETELGEIEERLHALGSSDRTLAKHLEINCGILIEAERHLWKEQRTLYLDQMNVERRPEQASARQLTFEVIRNSRGRQLLVLPVLIPLEQLPKSADFISEAKKYL